MKGCEEVPKQQQQNLFQPIINTIKTIDHIIVDRKTANRPYGHRVKQLLMAQNLSWAILWFNNTFNPTNFVISEQIKI